MVEYDDDVEVVYDIPFGNGNDNGNGASKHTKQSKVSRGGRSNGAHSNGARSNVNTNTNTNTNVNVNTNTNVNARNNSGGSGGVIGNYVDFENVFDPFERDQDDVGEFFDEVNSEEETHDWDKPNMFNDPRKVRKRKTCC